MAHTFSTTYDVSKEPYLEHHYSLRQLGFFHYLISENLGKYITIN